MTANTPIATGDPLFWPEDRWRLLQASRLAEHLRHAAASPLYRAHALQPDTPFHQLPLTTKDHLAAAGSSAWAVAPDQVAEWVCTSGTSGKSLDVPLTRADLDRLAQNEAVALAIAGVRAGDLFLIAVAMDRLFVAGLAYWLGAQKLGAACVRVGPQAAAHPDLLATLIARLNPALERRIFAITVPSFLTAAVPPPIPFAGIIAIGEPTRTESLAPNTLAQRLHDQFHCPILSTYAATETCTTFAEGPQCTGGHLNPALAVIEILDDSGRPLPPAQVGEVVITPLGMEGMPLLRFRTGDMAALFTDPCPCGRTTPRLGPILGRRQQLLKLRGTSVFPSAIIEALRTAPEVLDCIIIAERDELRCDRVTACIHAHEETPAVRDRVEARLRAMLRVIPAVRFVSPETLRALQASANGRKAARFIDHRPAGPDPVGGWGG